MSEPTLCELAGELTRLHWWANHVWGKRGASVPASAILVSHGPQIAAALLRLEAAESRAERLERALREIKALTRVPSFDFRLVARDCRNLAVAALEHREQADG